MQSVRVFTLGALTALCTGLSLQAQCGSSSFGSSIGTGDDTVLSIQSLGFAFPFGGVTYTDIHPTTNGFVYLSNAGVPAPGGALCCSGATATLVAGSPKIAPFWSDLVMVVGTGSVKFNALPGKAVITWENAVEFPSSGTSPRFTFQLQLLASGEIFFTHDARCAINTAGDFLVGMSQGGGAAVPAASDFSTAGVSTTTTNFELFNNGALTYDLAGQAVQFLPTGVGYAWVPQPCAAGGHVAYGEGCYKNTNDSIYQLTVAPAASSAALSNTAVTLLPSAGSYFAISAGTYVAPTAGATILATLTDDSEVATPNLAVPFPYPGGVATALTVCSNGFVSVATGNGVGFAPSAATMLGNLRTAWYAWHDFNPAIAASGKVKFEQVGNVAYITWDGVYNFGGTTAADASTVQFQFDASVGSVAIVHGTVSANVHTAFVAGEPHLVGFSPGGPSFDAGSVTFATALPVQVPAALLPLTLAAGAGLTSTPTSGSSTVFTTSNMPEYSPGAGIYIGLHIMSFGQVAAPGLDLGFLGAPGCPALVQSLDLTQAMVGVTSTNTVSFNVPMNIPSGLQLFSQSASLILPNSLSNGQNAFGLTTSNGVASTIGQW